MPNLDEVYNFLARMDKRINSLSMDTSFIEKKISAIDKTRTAAYGDMNDELKRLRVLLHAMGNELHQCTNEISSLGRSMKSAVKKDGFEQLSSAIDDIKFNEYITRKDIENI